MLVFRFRAKLWRYEGKAAWYFVTLPQRIARELRGLPSGRSMGWGSIRVEATVGTTTWKTSVFPVAATKTYLLPVKAAVRRAERLEDGQATSVTLCVVV